ncbi:unnamed protein product [Owenia fusiformis]|uniref:C2H2-type domain-containing protein n=1 Tax=Owenia fusiformis TaxID=6347 RepID=A0A8S4PG75_OWEFU|nr:unnamed protein product [Owenia fusiformis]
MQIKKLADDENDDTDIDNEDDMNDEMDTGESNTNEINDNLENVTTKQEPADSEQVAEPSTSANADQVEDDTKQHMDTKYKTSQWEQEEDEKHARETTEEKNTENVESNKVAEIRHRCDINQCTYTAKYKYLVNQHKKITHDGLRYHCEKCSKRFTRKHILEDHINVVHLKIQSFLCQLCSKAYSSMSSLTTHVKYKHEMVKHFTCCICKKGYFHKNDYESHMNNHSKVTPYQCKLCKKEFQIRNSFRNHQVDCGRKSEDKYKCEECQKYFSTNRSLSEHIKFQHRQINLFQCCGKTYKYPRSYKRHLKSNQHIDK